MTKEGTAPGNESFTPAVRFEKCEAERGAPLPQGFPPEPRRIPEGASIRHNSPSPGRSFHSPLGGRPSSRHRSEGLWSQKQTLPAGSGARPGQPARAGPAGFLLREPSAVGRGARTQSGARAEGGARRPGGSPTAGAAGASLLRRWASGVIAKPSLASPSATTPRGGEDVRPRMGRSHRIRLQWVPRPLQEVLPGASLS